LKQLAVSPAAPVEADGVAGQQPPHNGGKRSPAGLKQQVDMIEHQRPGKARLAGFIQDRSQTLNSVVTVLVIEKDLAAFDSRTIMWCNAPGASMSA
jgi:hypothetical protein